MKLQKRILFIIPLLLLFGCTGLNSADTKTALYKDPSQPVEKRVEDLVTRMTLDEKIGQMTQICKDVATFGSVQNMLLGSVLSGGGAAPRDNTVKGWQDFINAFQKKALSTRLGIPIIYGTDAVHGHNNMHNATIFPHNIGLGAAGDYDLVKRIGYASAQETAAAGIPWTFAPCIAVVRDPRWGRTYESFGQDTALVDRLGTAFLEGWQSADIGGATPVATAKHFLGDGNTVYGTSKAGSGKLDQGDMQETEAFVRNVLLPPYASAVKNGVRTVMTSFSSWNGEKLHAHSHLITGVLKGELGFTGFVVSDWQGIDQVDDDYYTAIVKGINAGIDMNMVPYDGPKFISTMKKAVKNGDIPLSRINDAVTRILRVKFETGLFEHPFVGSELASCVRSDKHLALAREAAAKSAVVLKNDGVLPLTGTAPALYVGGRGADDIGIQCGGWTITWQGKEGAITDGTTIFGALRDALPGTNVQLLNVRDIESAPADAICVVVAGEKPYAEFEGDTASLALPEADRLYLEAAAKHFEKVVLVLISGRPLVITDTLPDVNAAVAAWLPGTEGTGTVDVLTGKVSPTGKLPLDWPSSVAQLPSGNFISGKETPLFPAGYGLTW